LRNAADSTFDIGIFRASLAGGLCRF
jgi:hypothetical protein